ncbi:MAG: anion permease [Bilophila wadsworthia]
MVILHHLAINAQFAIVFTNIGNLLQGRQHDHFPAKGCIGLAILLGYFLLVSLPCPDGLSPNGKRAIAMMFAAVLVWVFEILPVAVASVLFAVLPAVAGILPLPKMMQLFATPTIFFVFAMFCIAIAFQNRPEPPHRPVDEPAIKGSPVRLLLLLMMVRAAPPSSRTYPSSP